MLQLTPREKAIIKIAAIITLTAIVFALYFRANCGCIKVGGEGKYQRFDNGIGEGADDTKV